MRQKEGENDDSWKVPASALRWPLFLLVFRHNLDPLFSHFKGTSSFQKQMSSCPPAFLKGKGSVSSVEAFTFHSDV